MRFEFKLRIGSLGIEASDYEYFVPFQITLWRYRQDGGGYSVCNLRWKHFAWHGWKDKSEIRFTCEPRVVSGRFIASEPTEEWDEIIDA